MNRVRAVRTSMLRVLLVSGLFVISSAFGFEGRIAATVARGGEAENLLYTAGTNFLRIERLETNWPHARDIVNLGSGEITLLYPHNRSFVRLKPGTENSSAMLPGVVSDSGAHGVTRPTIPQPASGVGSTGPSLTSASAAIGPTNLPDMPAMPQPPAGFPQRNGAQPGNPGVAPGMPAMPMIPMPPTMMEKLELVETNGTTNILGFSCSRYELKQRGEVMEIWATDKLFPFQPYVENQPHRFGPRMIEEQWGGLVAEKHVFPMLAVLRLENGPERMRFQVTSITQEKFKEDDEVSLFQPPPEYQEVQPLPF